jgi:uncharacterized protein YcbX
MSAPSATAGRIAWISVAPVKGLRLEDRDEVLLTEDGVPGDRAFFVVDAERGAMVSATRLGPLVGVVPSYDRDAGTLRLRFPGGEEVAGTVELGDPEKVRFGRRRVPARAVLDGYSEALSEHCGREVRLFATPPDGSALDRGREGAATLLSVASLERLRLEAGEREPIDRRRFRMTFGIEDLEPHEEDGWIGREVRAGDALLRVTGNVGRCALTTRDPDTGVVDLRTLHHLAGYRRGVETTEDLPFGVHAAVLGPGRVRRGDPVRPA